MSQANLEQECEAYLQAAADMYDDLRRWRAKHPAASFDEIAAQVSPRRRELMGELLAQLAGQHGDGKVLEGKLCPEFGQPMVYKGRAQRGRAMWREDRPGAGVLLLCLV
jgi:hypothetical protein